MMEISSTLSVESEFIGSENRLLKRFFNKLIFSLVVIDLLLGMAHLFWPEYSWGQNRSSYFNFGNSLTLASWFVSIQLLATAVLFFVAYQKNRRNFSERFSILLWLSGSGLLFVLSFAEITKIFNRLKLFGFPHPDLYEQVIISFFQIVFLIIFGWFILNSLRTKPSYKKFSTYWLILWCISIAVNSFGGMTLIANNNILFTFISGLTFLLGCTFLFASAGAYVFLQEEVSESNPTVLEICKTNPFPAELPSTWRFIGIGGMTFTIIFIQILLFRVLSIYTDYLTASSIISIALVGISIGGLVGWRFAKNYPMQLVLFASILLPLTIILTLAVVVKLTIIPLLTASLLMFPFIFASAVITVLLIRTKSHLVYAVDLIGAAVGAMMISPALNYFREESAIILLSMLTLTIAGCFVYYLPPCILRNKLYTTIGIGAVILFTIGISNTDHDWLNIVRTKLESKYPEAEFLYSQSSFVGRYDVVYTHPGASTYKTFDNGRTIDNIRNNPVEEYIIDPRLPYTYMNNPKILIIGLSGDGITKTAKAVSNDITGIEINPAIVDLQKNELAELSNNSYEDIDVYVMDGKSFVAQSEDKYDMITLMNAHSVRGSIKGKSASPEYLHTVEAFEDYLNHLSDKGLVNIEEPVHIPEQEPAVWKLIATMKQALLNRGIDNPADHFFVFQWRTKQNNYIQILMKKTPFTAKDIVNLRVWLDEVDRIKELESTAGRRLGPIRAVTTILYSPNEDYQTNYARILNDQVDENFLQSKNLNLITDDRPFLFGVDPDYGEVKLTYVNTFLISLLIFPFLLSFLLKHRTKLRSSFPFALIVMLTGMGYLLIEVVLIQRYQLFLGSPI